MVKITDKTNIKATNGATALYSKGSGTKITSSAGNKLDITVNAGTTLGVIPIYGFRAGVKQDLNVKKVLGNIDPTSLKSLSAGVNVTMLGAIPSWGVSAGFDKDKIDNYKLGLVKFSGIDHFIFDVAENKEDNFEKVHRFRKNVGHFSKNKPSFPVNSRTFYFDYWIKKALLKRKIYI